MGLRRHCNAQAAHAAEIKDAAAALKEVQHAVFTFCKACIFFRCVLLLPSSMFSLFFIYMCFFCCFTKANARESKKSSVWAGPKGLEIRKLASSFSLAWMLLAGQRRHIKRRRTNLRRLETEKLPDCKWFTLPSTVFPAGKPLPCSLFQMASGLSKQNGSVALGDHLFGCMDDPQDNVWPLRFVPVMQLLKL